MSTLKYQRGIWVFLANGRIAFCGKVTSEMFVRICLTLISCSFLINIFDPQYFNKNKLESVIGLFVSVILVFAVGFSAVKFQHKVFRIFAWTLLFWINWFAFAVGILLGYTKNKYKEIIAGFSAAFVPIVLTLITPFGDYSKFGYPEGHNLTVSFSCFVVAILMFGIGGFSAALWRLPENKIIEPKSDEVLMKPFDQ
ncbi:MAG: hypothetical protein ACYTFY_09905 [Planctomycetota bacterium]|jgi:hypothetical protein